MTNNSDKPKKKVEEMRAEYDFSGGVRGKHAAAYHEGHSVTIHKKDGTTVVQNFKLEEGAVVLEPDVREYFQDAESVNDALRTLIAVAAKTKKLSGGEKVVVIGSILIDLRGSIPVSGKQDFEAVRKKVLTKRAKPAE